MSIPLILLLSLPLVHMAVLPRLFSRAGLTSWHGYVPGLNYWTLLTLLKRPKHWIIPLLFPGPNLLMVTILNVELGIAFGKRSTAEQWLYGALPWVALPRLAFGDASEFVGTRDWSKVKKSMMREWGEAILWATVVASLIRGYVFEAFTIPTASMEDSMLVGDYLVVSKMSYGPKVPETPLSLPFVHNAIPGTNLSKSYLEWVKIPYSRLPGFGDVERYDAVVFNFPNGDSIVVDPYLAGHDYHALIRQRAMGFAGGDPVAYEAERERFNSMSRREWRRTHGIKARPVDKKEHYVKRCVGLPGEDLAIVDRKLVIDGVEVPSPTGLQFNYLIRLKREADLRAIRDRLGLTDIDIQGKGQSGTYFMALREDEALMLKEQGLVADVQPLDVTSRRGTLDMYPNTNKFDFGSWDLDNYGPIHLPAAGETVELTPRNIALYRRVITAYEGHDLQEREGVVLLDGEPATEYTFSQGYYWLMGDNRHSSADSRYWGFVPEDHVVGRASFTWFSKMNEAQHGESGIRWGRMFKAVK
jgi:signal peptidase I